MGGVTRISGRALAWDLLLAAVVAVVILVGSSHAALWQPARQPPDAVAYVLFLVAIGGVAARRWLPALAAAVLATAVYLALGYAYGPILLAPIIALYTMGSLLPLRRSAPAAITAVAALVISELPAVAGASPGNAAISLSAWHLWFLVPWAIGAGLRMRREDTRRGREEAGRRHAYEERLRIAREVHDIVGHGLAVINMQAGVALHVVDRRPEQARVALEAIKQASKDALEELRVTLDIYRRPDEGADAAVRPDRDGEEARRPAPGLAQVDGVVAAMAESGLAVRLEVTGSPVALPAAVDLAAYRIVQESLTNVVRHAGPASARVQVRYEPGEVVLEITDDGRARVGAGARGAGGHGIAGMRERAAAVHGTLEAGPRPDGGFRVLARLPSGGLGT